MPSFKPKANKKIIEQSSIKITMDNKHNEKMQEFHNIENSKLPEIDEKLKKMKKTYDGYKNKNASIEEKLQLIEDINKLKKERNRLKNKKKKYLLENAEYIFEYFDKKKDLTEDNNKTKILHSFFNKTNKDNDGEIEINNIQQYLINQDYKYINLNDYVKKTDICERKKCYGELVAVEHEGVKICNKCGIRINYLLTNDKPSYKEPPKEVCFYAYKRINHFREILAQFQAKETTQIPKVVITGIKNQIIKERIDLKDITNIKAKDILKKLGYNKYYEHIPFIKDKLGISPPVMTSQLEDKLCSLFMDIQRPYSKHCPDTRVNFLNYYYVLYKMCELLGETIFLPYFPMLKDKVKRIEQDEIWKDICKELSWEYIPTL
jgi:hypothetical protein